MSPDFGNAVRQDLAAQIADPDAHYKGTPAPGSDGERVGLAQKRYSTGQVIQPAAVTASGAASIGRADNGASTGVSTAAGASQ
jgi:type IV pilus biogenesis protein CpaD/CtpE